MSMSGCISFNIGKRMAVFMGVFNLTNFELHFSPITEHNVRPT